MITSETPDKLAEIIRDTWPQIFRPMKKTWKENTSPIQSSQKKN